MLIPLQTHFYCKHMIGNRWIENKSFAKVVRDPFYQSNTYDGNTLILSKTGCQPKELQSAQMKIEDLLHNINQGSNMIPYLSLNINCWLHTSARTGREYHYAGR